jgi:hypothetical protein
MKERDHLGDLDVDGRVILKLILNKVRGCGLDSTGWIYGPVAVSCGHGNESMCSRNAGYFLTT